MTISELSPAPPSSEATSTWTRRHVVVPTRTFTLKRIGFVIRDSVVMYSIGPRSMPSGPHGSLMTSSRTTRNRVRSPRTRPSMSLVARASKAKAVLEECSAFEKEQRTGLIDCTLQSPHDHRGGDEPPKPATTDLPAKRLLSLSDPTVKDAGRPRFLLLGLQLVDGSLNGDWLMSPFESGAR